VTTFQARLLPSGDPAPNTFTFLASTDCEGHWGTAAAAAAAAAEPIW
jgi:hypothetical protein